MNAADPREPSAAEAGPAGQSGGGEPSPTGELPVANEHTLKVLELPQLLARVASLAMSPLGAELARRLAPSADLALVERRQRRLSQLRALVSERGRPGLDGLTDVRPLLSRLAVDGAYLLPEELTVMADFLGATGRAAEVLQGGEGRFDELYRLYNRLTPLPEIALRLRRVVGPGNSVASSASVELSRIRRDLGAARERLRGQLSALVSRDDLAGVFSDQIVTQRADRFVVPVRTDAKGRLTGIIHDTSGSGATCFVEPLEAVEGNNQMALLRRKEREEEERVLIEASRALASHLQVLRENLGVLAKLDCLLAQAEFCERLHCAEPILDAGGRVELLAARHPLLAWRAAQGRGQAVPINVSLDEGQRVLVVSGANAGGKTATLKTVGLVTLMVMCGMHPPCLQGSRVAIFSQVLAEVGDDQSLESDLSTFTAHAGRLAWMVQRAGRGSLALIDEIGGGTDPGEGAALAVAVLDWLKGRGVRVLCTTHFHRLKAYAAQAEGVENVSVAFDPMSGRPTYQLTYGLPGFSDALAVSRSLGFPPELVEAARAQVDQGEAQTLALMRQVRQALDEAQASRAAAAADRLVAANEREQARAMQKAARREQAGALAEGKRRVREVAARLERRLEELFERARSAQEEHEAAAQAASEAGAQPPTGPRPGRVRQELYGERRQALKEVEAAVLPPPSPQGEAPSLAGLYACKAGDPVLLTALGQRGVLLEDPRPGLETMPVSVGVGGVRVVMALREMEPLPRGQAKDQDSRPRSGVSVQASAGDGIDLNVVGLTVDDALPKVDKALDQAILAGKTSFAVVHGVGTGRLRAAVREFLDNHPYVVATHRAEGRRGGAGVTVAELRE